MKKSSIEKKLESSCRKAIFDFNMVEDASAIAIALSGGKDSLSLLFLLHSIIGKGTKKIDLHAIHVTGAYSCGANLGTSCLKEICDKLNINFIVKEMKEQATECYSCSRIRRTLIFKEAKRKNISHVAFGHHKDDNIETLLLNLFHKGEFAGNLAKLKMVDYEVTIIRPLIYVSEKDIINFASSRGFLRVMCNCPIGQNSKRKKVKQIIDKVEEEFPNVRENLSSASINYGSKKAEKN